MFLELKNFRSYESLKLELPDTGLVLLNGPSGIGKTNIMKAINFVLYDEGTKLVTYTKKSCKVIFTIKGMVIERTKTPNHLEIELPNGDVLEDDAAQQHIYKIFGRNFTTTSYITQKALESFVNLSPADKLIFLEELALGDTNIAEWKKKTKEKIKKRKNILTEIVGERKVIEEETKSMVKPKKVDYPLEGKYSIANVKRHRAAALEKITQRGEYERKIKTLKNKLAEEQEIREQAISLEANKITIEEQLSGLKEELDENESAFESDEYISQLDESIKEYTQYQDFLERDNSYKKEKAELEELKLQEQQRLTLQINQLKMRTEEDQDYALMLEDLINEIDKIKTNQRLTIELTKITKEITLLGTEELDLKKLERIEQRIINIDEDKQKLSSRVLATKIHQCPGCQAHLQIDLEKKSPLILIRNIPKNGITPEEFASESKELSDIRYKMLLDQKSINDNMAQRKSLQKQLEEIEKNLSLVFDISKRSIPLIDSDIQSLRVKIKDQEKLKLLLSQIKDDPYTESLKVMIKKNQKLKDTLKKEQAEFSEVVSKEDYEEYCEIYKQQVDFSLKISSLKKKIVEQEKALAKITKELAQLDSNNNYAEEIKKVDEEMEVIKNQVDANHKTEQELAVYLQYKEKLKEYQKWNEKMEGLISREDKIKTSLETAETFLRLLQESESIAIGNTIQTLNEHLQYYLDRFFKEPLQISVDTFKENTRGEKIAKINFKTIYKGHDCDISNLSGGQHDRVMLSICLALNSMNRSPLLLLDECLSSLHNDLVGDILDVLKEDIQTEPELILLVLHQATLGVFDHIIDVESLVQGFE